MTEIKCGNKYGTKTLDIQSPLLWQNAWSAYWSTHYLEVQIDLQSDNQLVKNHFAKGEGYKNMEWFFFQTNFENQVRKARKPI